MLRRFSLLVILSFLGCISYAQIPFELTYEYYPLTSANEDRPVKSEIKTKIVYVPNSKDYRGFVTKKVDATGLFWVGHMKYIEKNGKVIRSEITYIDHSRHPIKLISFKKAQSKKPDSLTEKERTERTIVNNMLQQLK